MSGPYWSKAWNPVQGCTPVSPGCAHCWAKAMHERFHPEPFSAVTLHPERLSIPLRTRKPQVFFTDMCDPFHPDVPFEFIAAMFGVMAASPRHTFLLLTKRAERMRTWFEWIHRVPGNAAGTEAMEVQYQAQGYFDKVDDAETGGTLWPKRRTLPRAESWPLPNVWLGVTAEDQQRADERIPLLLQTPAAHRWVSLEPLLGPIDMKLEWLARRHIDCAGCAPDGSLCDGHWIGQKLNQVIVGGESGPNARPYDLAWARSVIGQCQDAGVACFHKQIGARPRADLLVSDGNRLVEAPHANEDHGRIFGMRSRSGSDPAEWPEDLRIRELAWVLP